MITIYHGSTVDIEHIDLLKSRPNKDFGRGFYLSADRQQAWRMGEFKAWTEGGSPVMYTYLFDEKVLVSDELRVLTFEGYTREWADFIFLNRLASRGKGNQQDENNGDYQHDSLKHLLHHKISVYYIHHIEYDFSQITYKKYIVFSQLLSIECSRVSTFFQIGNFIISYPG